MASSFFGTSVSGMGRSFAHPANHIYFTIRNLKIDSLPEK